jgi:hypothetical protein
MTLYSETRAASKAAGEKNDCAVVAIAIACQVEYRLAHYLLKKRGRKYRRGTRMNDIVHVVKLLGYRLTPVPVKSKTVRTLGREMVNTEGHYFVRATGHVLAIVDGSVQDWTSNRLKRVLGVWKVELDD